MLFLLEDCSDQCKNMPLLPEIWHISTKPYAYKIIVQHNFAKCPNSLKLCIKNLHKSKNHMTNNGEYLLMF